jgi:hypothetical protein
MIAKLADIAETQIGVREEGGNNKGATVRQYQFATNLQPSAWPWCAAFVCWCVQHWLESPANKHWLGLKIMTPEGWRPRTAAAFGFIPWSRERPATTLMLPETATPQRGDIVVFDFSHIGIVSGTSRTKVLTIEGNTNGRGDRDSTSGDGVWSKERPRSLARCYIRIRPSQ